LVLIPVQSSFAAENTQADYFDIVAAKKTLAKDHLDKLNSNLSEKQIEDRVYEIQRTLNKLASGDGDANKLENQLLTNNVYKLEVPEEELLVSPLSQGSDIILNKVIIMYDSKTGYWFVAGGGSWRTDNWKNDAPEFILPLVGSSKNVGGMDAIGVSYFNTSGTYNASVIGSLGYWHDGEGNSVESSNPSAGDGKYGVAFEFQDKVTVKSNNLPSPIVEYELSYMGYGFSATITYDSNFENWNGKARTLYAHTWVNTEISSITFHGNSNTFGADVNFSNQSNKFWIYNGADTNF